MRYCPILFCFPLREDDFVDKEEDQHQNVTVQHRGSDVIDKVRHQQARNRRSHTRLMKLTKQVIRQNASTRRSAWQGRPVALDQVSDFYSKPGKRSGSSPKRQLQSCLFRPRIKCISTTMIHGRELRTQKFIRCSFLCIR